MNDPDIRTADRLGFSQIWRYRDERGDLVCCTEPPSDDVQGVERFQKANGEWVRLP